MVSATRSAPRTAARSVSASAAPTWSWSSRPALSAMAIRRISRRRMSRISRMALSGSACRDIFEAISCHCASKLSGASSLSVPSQATDSGETSRRSAISRELESTWHSRSAAAVESRSMPRYQCVVPRRLADPAEGEQPGVGVHAFGEPAQQDRQELPLECGAAADAGGERLDVPHGAGRVQVAQRGEPALRGFRGQPGLFAAERGGRVEQRPVEDAVVQFADGALGPAPGGHQGVRLGPLRGEGPQHRLGQGAQRRPP